MNLNAPAQTHFATLADRVYMGLRNQIIEGKLRPGARLVRERVGKDFGVSPIPVTEALWRLEQDGLVESQPMFGSRVKVLTTENLRHEQVLREAIECQAARLCAEKASPAQIGTLFEKAKPLDEVLQLHEYKSREGLMLHVAFHVEVARYSGCPLLVKELQRVGFLEYMRVSWVQGAMFPGPTDWHQQLVKVLAERDPDKADAKMREHVRYGIEHEVEALQKLLALNGASSQEEKTRGGNV